jgi:ribonuclease BN (tRNA processing enzyme)
VPGAHSGLTLTVLGACGSWPGPGAAASGYLVRHGDTAVALDLGSGTLANLQRHIGLDALDAVVLTHEHPDHWVDVTGLAVALRYGLGLDGVALCGTAGALEVAGVALGGGRSGGKHRDAGAADGAGALDALVPPFAPNVVADGDEVVVGSLRLRFAVTDHSVPTLSVRVDALDARDAPGALNHVPHDAAPLASLAYSADTGPSWSFATLGDGIDLALCEATYLHDARPPGVAHLSAREAGAMAAAAGVRSLLITHLAPGTDSDDAAAEASAAFGAPVAVAVEGDTVVVA